MKHGTPPLGRVNPRVEFDNYGLDSFSSIAFEFIMIFFLIFIFSLTPSVWCDLSQGSHEENSFRPKKRSTRDTI
jgi:hypothetical protein